MNKGTIVAKRYAKALFQVAHERGRAAEVGQQLSAIAEAISQTPGCAELLRHPKLEVSQKIAILQNALEGRAAEEVLHTFELLVQRGREELLDDLHVVYTQIANEALGQAQAKVYTSVVLSDEEAKKVAATFGKLTGKTIQVENIVDPSLLGGLQVRIGDRLYDGSLSGKLRQLEKALIQA